MGPGGRTAQRALDLALCMSGDHRADVAIVGGGFVGLWTAYHLKKLEPQLRVVVLERGTCGSGASGINGGFLMSWWSKIACLLRACGTEDALWLAAQSTDAVSGLAPLLEQYGVDAELVLKGWMWTATSRGQIGSWNGLLDTLDKLGHGHVFRELAADEVARRSGSPVHLAGVFEAVNGTVHPARLVQGLTGIVSSMGVQIFDHTPVRSMERSRPVRLVCDRGSVYAERVVLASNAWAAAVPELARSFVCATSSVVSTPPIPARLAEIGWTGGESITDSQSTVLYYRTTADGRIVFGKGGGQLAFTGEPPTWVFDHADGIEAAAKEFRRVYPMLADVPIERGWSGPIDRSLDGLPMLGTLPRAPHIAYGIGWSGNGVGPSRVGGRILAGLALEHADQWTQNGLVGRRLRTFPPEPLRFVGGRLLRAALARADQADILGRPTSAVDRAVLRLAPRGFETS